jgi:hypothetical protein
VKPRPDAGSVAAHIVRILSGRGLGPLRGRFSRRGPRGEAASAPRPTPAMGAGYPTKQGLNRGERTGREVGPSCAKPPLPGLRSVVARLGPPRGTGPQPHPRHGRDHYSYRRQPSTDLGRPRDTDDRSRASQDRTGRLQAFLGKSKQMLRRYVRDARLPGPRESARGVLLAPRRDRGSPRCGSAGAGLAPSVSREGRGNVMFAPSPLAPGRATRGSRSRADPRRDRPMGTYFSRRNSRCRSFSLVRINLICSSAGRSPR